MASKAAMAIKIIDRKLKEREMVLKEALQADKDAWGKKNRDEQKRAIQAATAFLQEEGFHLARNEYSSPVNVSLAGHSYNNYKESPAMKKLQAEFSVLKKKATALKDEIGLTGIDPAIIARINELFGQ